MLRSRDGLTDRALCGSRRTQRRPQARTAVSGSGPIAITGPTALRRGDRPCARLIASTSRPPVARNERQASAAALYEPLAATGVARPFVPAAAPRIRPGRQRPKRVLAMPTWRGTKLMDNRPLLGPPAIALRHRPQYRAPRAHAAWPRHRRHQSDSVTRPSH
jgi:hypothetical protein